MKRVPVTCFGGALTHSLLAPVPLVAAAGRSSSCLGLLLEAGLSENKASTATSNGSNSSDMLLLFPRCLPVLLKANLALVSLGCGSICSTCNSSSSPETFGALHTCRASNTSSSAFAGAITIGLLFAGRRCLAIVSSRSTSVAMRAYHSDCAVLLAC